MFLQIDTGERRNVPSNINERKQGCLPEREGLDLLGFETTTVGLDW